MIFQEFLEIKIRKKGLLSAGPVRSKRGTTRTCGGATWADTDPRGHLDGAQG